MPPQMDPKLIPSLHLKRNKQTPNNTTSTKYRHTAFYVSLKPKWHEQQQKNHLYD